MIVVGFEAAAELPGEVFRDLHGIAEFRFGSGGLTGSGRQEKSDEKKQ